MIQLITAIKNLYDTFSKYTTEGIHHCDCGCIKEEEVRKLNSKTLRNLEEDDLVSYHGSALYTWGDIEHYKHYLPRILELRSLNRNHAFIDLKEIFSKLDYGKWNDWDENEKQAITDFIIADWIEFANKQYSEIRDIELKAYANFLELKELLRLWDISKSEKALKNFVYFFYYHGTQILNGGLKINDKKYEEDFISLILTNKLVNRLETEFFKNEVYQQDYKEKISIVLQMIEQYLKIKNHQ